MSSWEKQAVEHSRTTRESIRGRHQPVKDPFQFECLQSPDPLPVKHLYPFEFPPPPPQPEVCARRPPLPVVESRPSPSSGTSCRGCFRPSESQPLSDLQLLDYPWGGYPGPGEVFAHKFAFETGELPFDEDSFYWPGEDRFDNTYELVTEFLTQVRQSKGYDVDCHPPSQLFSPFLPVRDLEWLAPDNEYYQKRFHEPTLFALQSINAKMVVEVMSL